jgi:hypothetical protein
MSAARFERAAPARVAFSIGGRSAASNGQRRHLDVTEDRRRQFRCAEFSLAPPRPERPGLRLPDEGSDDVADSEADRRADGPDDEYLCACECAALATERSLNEAKAEQGGQCARE